MSKPNSYKRTGWGFILLSVFCIVIFLVDYKTQFIFKLISISELGTILGGTSGVFVSLAGLFFVLENLEMQRETILHQQTSIDLQREELRNQILEMQESNSYFREQTQTLKKQTSESSFFQLLENHRSLVESLNFNEDNGYSGLSKYYRELKRNNEHYYQAAMTKDVANTEYGTYYPLRALKPQIENIEQLYSNIYHLINFIKLKLENELFYHETFYNSLSKAEKYIIGLYIVNEKTDFLSVFQTEGFNYLEYFEGSGNAYYNKNTIPFFPHMNFTFVNPWCKFNLSEFRAGQLDQKTGEIKLVVLNNEFSKQVILKDTVLEYNWNGTSHSISDGWDLDIGNSNMVNIYSQIKEHVLLKFHDYFKDIRKISQFRFFLKVIFVISYNDREYRYTTKWHVVSHNTNDEGAELLIEADN